VKYFDSFLQNTFIKFSLALFATMAIRGLKKGHEFFPLSNAVLLTSSLLFLK